jgi:hypothetical protein
MAGNKQVSLQSSQTYFIAKIGFLAKRFLGNKTIHFKFHNYYDKL